MPEGSLPPYEWLAYWRGMCDAEQKRPYACRHKDKVLAYWYRRGYTIGHFHPEAGAR